MAAAAGWRGVARLHGLVPVSPGGGVLHQDGGQLLAVLVALGARDRPEGDPLGGHRHPGQVPLGELLPAQVAVEDLHRLLHFLLSPVQNPVGGRVGGVPQDDAGLGGLTRVWSVVLSFLPLAMFFLLFRFLIFLFWVLPLVSFRWFLSGVGRRCRPAGPPPRGRLWQGGPVTAGPLPGTPRKSSRMASSPSGISVSNLRCSRTQVLSELESNLSLTSHSSPFSWRAWWAPCVLSVVVLD